MKITVQQMITIMLIIIKKNVGVIAALFLQISVRGYAQDSYEPDRNNLVNSEISENNTGDEEKNLTIKIGAVDNDKALNYTTVKIYYHNKLVEELNNGRHSGLKVALKNNSYYILEVLKPGYIPKSLMIATSLSGENTLYEHHILVSLVKQPLANKIVPSIPFTGILYYDAKEDLFVGEPLRIDSPKKQDIITLLEGWFDSSSE